MAEEDLEPEDFAPVLVEQHDVRPKPALLAIQQALHPGSLADLKLPESLARLKEAADDAEGPEVVREEARRLLEGHR